MFFLHDVVERSNLASADRKNASSDDESFYDEDYDDFDSVSSGELEDQMIVESEAQPAPSALGLSDNSDPSDSPPSLTPTATQNTNTNDNGNTPQDTRKPPKGKSIAHYDLKAKRIVFYLLTLRRGARIVGLFSSLLNYFARTMQVQRIIESQNRVIHQLYVVVIYCAKFGIGLDEWEVYLKKNGRKKFQIDLARDCMNYAIRHAWKDLNGPKPNWMRQTELIPCECKKCFFV